jgi:two-component system, cell cycle response regulator DivK
VTVTRVLIVDDNPQNVKLVRLLLVDEGYDVRSASDAEEALRVLDGFEAQAILMDIQLPGMDGLELTRHLKADARWTRLVVIALTAYAMKGDEEKALAAGCDGYVTKPIDIDALVELLPRLIAAKTATP